MVFVWAAVFVVSVGALVKGAGMLLESAKRIGEWAGFSAFTIGVVILGFGTSAPELVSSIAAQIQGVPDIVAGNVVGSNIVNVLLVAALMAVVARGVIMKLEDATFDIAWLIVSVVAFLAVAWNGVISVNESIFLLFAFALYSVAIYAFTSDNRALVPTEKRPPAPRSRDIATLVGGFILLAVGAHFTVIAAVNEAALLQIGTGVIGLLAIALGTSLPELVVTVRAVRTDDTDIALGNIFGSNVFNVLFIVGIAGSFGVMTVGATTLLVGLAFMIIATAVLATAGFRKYFSMWLGIFALAAYGAFVTLAILLA